MNNVKAAFNALTAGAAGDRRSTPGRGRAQPGRVDARCSARSPTTTATPTRSARAAAASSPAASRRRTTSRTGCASFALPLLPILREDQDPESAARAVGGPDRRACSRSKHVRASDPYKKGAYHKVVDTFYDDPWFQGHAHFADGAHVQLRGHRPRALHAEDQAQPAREDQAQDQEQEEDRADGHADRPEPQLRRRRRRPRAACPKEKLKPGENRTTVKLSGTIERPTARRRPGVEMLLELISGAYERVEPARRKKL